MKCFSVPGVTYKYKFFIFIESKIKTLPHFFIHSTERKEKKKKN